MRKMIYRGEVFYFVASPTENKQSYRYFEDGALAVEDGKILKVGPFHEVLACFPEFIVKDYSGYLIMPGLIDTHIHFPQTEMVGMYGKQLLDWLSDYTFPTERAFASQEHADEIARLFLMELFKNGTTTCSAYASVHPQSVNALFSAASTYNMCIMAGKVLMNRNCPEYLQDTTVTGIEETRELIEKWHGKGRNIYVITPRFAITSTFDQMEEAARLHKEYPTTYIQTHLSENKGEIASVKSLFPDSIDYLDVYEKAGLLTDRSIFAHCVHLTEREYKRLAEVSAIVAHCPTSNLFLGSGLYDMRKANEEGLRTTFATDVAGGTSFSMWKTMGESYKVQQLQGYSMDTLEMLYKSTLGSAKVLGLDGQIGSFAPLSDADFIVVDYQESVAQRMRMDNLKKRGQANIENKLFGLQILGDDRNTVATYIMGKEVYAKSPSKL